MAVGDAFLLTSQFAAAALFLLLAGVLLAVRFNSRVNRAFAVFLFLRGANLLFLALARWQTPDSEAYEALIATARYLYLALPFALVYFAAVFWSPQGGALVRWVGLGALLGVLVVETAYLLDHCAAACPSRPDVVGPLYIVSQAVPLMVALVGLALALKARTLRANARGPATAIVAAAFTLLALLESSPVTVTLATNGAKGFSAPYEANAWIVLGRAEALLALVTALAGAIVLTTVLRTGRRQRLFVGCAAVMVFTALYATAGESSPEASSQLLTATLFLFGFWRLLAASLVAYALVRHRFLDLDLRINWTISRGTVIAILAATFLVVSKVIENQLNARLGVLFGGIAAGLLMIAIKPLERLGDRVADGLLPRGRRERLARQHKIEIFREQATMVWSDGHMGRKERLLLDHLRERLGIDAAEAVRIEHEAASQSPFSSEGRALSTQV